MTYRIDPKPSRTPIPPDKRDALIGTTARVTYGGLTFDVIIKARKTAYGTDRWLVTPVAGQSEAWLKNIEPKQL
jgi:hypothetical protein